MCAYLILALDYKLHEGRNSPQLSLPESFCVTFLCSPVHLMLQMHLLVTGQVLSHVLLCFCQLCSFYLGYRPLNTGLCVAVTHPYSVLPQCLVHPRCRVIFTGVPMTRSSRGQRPCWTHYYTSSPQVEPQGYWLKNHRTCMALVPIIGALQSPCG